MTKTTPHTAPPPDELNLQAGEYVLGTLDPQEQQAIEQRLPHNGHLQAAVAQWQDRLLPLTQLVATQPLPPHLWARIDRSITEQTSPSTSKAQPKKPAATQPGALSRLLASAWWNHTGLWRGLAGAGLAMTVVLASLLALNLQGQAATPQFMVVLVAPQDKAPGWVVQTSDQQQSMQLIPLTNTTVPTQNALQFWTKADDWNAPKSLGLVKPGQVIRIPLEQLPPLQANQLFELTLEPATGSPTGKPTGPIQFIGRAVKLTS